MGTLTKRGILLLAGALSACSPALDLTPGTPIACADDGECPLNWICTKAGRCVAPDALDVTAPGLVAAPTVTPAFLKEGLSAEVRFEVTEDLLEAPVVKLALDDATSPKLTLDAAASSGRSYVFRTDAATGSETQARACPLSIELKDLAGNESGALPGGEVRFDFTPPTIRPDLVTLKNARAKKGAVIELGFHVSEVVVGEPAVALQKGGTFVQASASGGQDFVFTHTAGDDEDQGPEGQSIAVAVVDPAGNAATIVLEPKVVFDFTPPALAFEVNPQNARAWQMVTITLTSSEPLAGPPTVDSGALALGVPSVAGNTYSWTHQVQEGEEATYPLTATGVDLAGNSSASAAVDVKVDGKPPAASNVVVPDSVVGANGVITVSFDVDEALKAAPEVRLDNGASPVIDLQPVAAIPPYGYTYQGTAPPLGAGGSPFYAVTLKLEDLAGNLAVSQPATVEIDTTAPTATARVLPAAARLHDTVRVILNASEPLGEVPAVVARSGASVLAFQTAGAAGALGYEFTAEVVEGLAQGTYQFDPIALKDVAGNPGSAASPDSFTVDPSVPAVSNVKAVEPRRSRVAGYDVVHVAFDLSEDVGAGLSAKVDGKPMTCSAFQAQSPNHTCTWAVLATDTEGPKDVAIQATDAAGNTGFGSGSVTFDFTPPSQTTAFLPEVAGAGTVHLRVTPSEALAAEPEIRVATAAGEALACSLVAGSLYLYACPVAAGADGDYLAEVSMTDLAGNPSGKLSAVASLAVDTAAPAIESLAASVPVLGPEARDTVFSFNVADAHAGTLEVSLDGVALDGCSSAAAGTTVAYECPYHLEDALVPLESDLVRLLVVRAVDAAGNAQTASLPLELDFLAPEVIAGSLGAAVVAGAENLVLRPAGLAPKNAVLVSFAVNETLAGPPVATLTGSTQALCASLAGNTATLTLGFGAAGVDAACNPTSLAEGPLSVDVALADALGNARTVTLAPGLAIDATAPGAPATEVSGAVVHRRAPWGDAASAQASFSVVGASGAAEAGATVFVFDGADRTAQQLGQAVAASDGSFEVSLVRSDRAEVYLTAADASGNLSAFSRVRDGRFLATLGGKVQGSSLENPTELTTSTSLRASLRPEPETLRAPSTADTALAALDDGAVLTVQGAERWLQRPTDGVAPALRSGAGSAWDPVRGRWVIFGGSGASGRLGDTWEYDPVEGRWRDATPPGVSPSSRGGVFMAYDSRLGRVVLFGGVSSAGPMADTWSWDGTAWYEHTPVASPSVRYGGCAVFDEVSGKLVLFGGMGATSSTFLSETWLFDAAADTWTMASPTTRPGAWTSCSMAYDAGRGRVVLFGGETGGYQLNPDLWEWNGGTGQWSKRALTNPTARSGSTLCYQPERGRLLLFGGRTYSPSTTWLGDTWELDPAAGTWAQRSPASALSARENGALACTGSGALFFGGQNNGALQGGTWRWEGGEGLWSDDSPGSTSPPSVEGARLVYDAGRQRGVYLGPSSTLTAEETWEYQGSTARWTKKSPAASPPVRQHPAVAYDALRKVVVLFGGYASGTALADTWEWDGTTWTSRTSATTPPARYQAAVAWDATNGRTVLYGGTKADGSKVADTWEWDGNDWTDVSALSATTPAARSNARMTWDANAAGLVMEGGGRAGTWVRASADRQWRQVLSSDPPGSYITEDYGGAGWLLYDPERRLSRLALAINTYHQASELWSFDAALATPAWTKMALPLYPPNNNNYTVATQDTGRGRMVALAAGQTWELDSRSRARPVALWAVPWRSAGVDRSALTGLVLSGKAGGTGAEVGVAGAVQGIEALLWDRAHARWQSALTNTSASAGAPEAFSYESDDGAALAAMLQGADERLDVAVAPLAPTGAASEQAKLALDYLELELRYRLP